MRVAYEVIVDMPGDTGHDLLLREDPILLENELHDVIASEINWPVDSKVNVRTVSISG